MNENKVKILLCGDVEGKFNTLFNKVENINKKSGPFDLLLCVGNFFGINNKEFDAYKSSVKKVSVPTYILGPNQKDHCNCYPDNEEDFELCHNIYYLGKRGVYTSTSGLKIAYISGISTETNVEKHNYTSEDAIALRDLCLRGNPNFKGVDILLTAQWPAGINSNDPNNDKLDIRSSSYQISWLAGQLRPRYHVSGLEGIFYERAPYRNYNNGDLDIASRFLGLSRVGNPKKEKWIYAVCLTPVDKMKISELFQKTTDETNCPYDLEDLDAKVNKRKRKVDGSRQYFFDMNAPEDASKGKRKGKKQKVTFDQSKCWFCLASPSVEKHLVITVGTSIYLALAKGGLVEEHFLICPIEHHQCTTVLQHDVLQEIEKFKAALRKFYGRNGNVPVFFERNFKTSHMQIQAIPIPTSATKEIKDIFKEEADGNGFELQELESHNRLDQVLPSGVPYFSVELPSREVLYTIIQGPKQFPLNFGREVLATGPILDLQERVEWKDCILKREEEEDLVARLRVDFEPFDINE